jgi:hypothetical protein
MTVDPDPETPQRYVSQDGFVIVPLLRGFTAIKELWSSVLQLQNGSAFVCGGYARYCASPKPNVSPAADFDIYCPTEEVLAKVRDTLAETFELDVKHENFMSLSYKRAQTGPLVAAPPIQLIKPVREGRIVTDGSLEEILSNFDFTVIRAAILNEKEVLVDADFEHDETRRLLRLKNIHCPVSSLLRCLKYAKKGYWLRPMEALALFVDWERRDDEYRLKLIDYLSKANEGTELTQEEIDELYALLCID